MIQCVRKSAGWIIKILFPLQWNHRLLRNIIPSGGHQLCYLKCNLPMIQSVRRLVGRIIKIFSPGYP